MSLKIIILLESMSPQHYSKQTKKELSFFFFLALSCLSILDISPLLDTSLANIFSHTVAGP